MMLDGRAKTAHALAKAKRAFIAHGFLLPWPDCSGVARWRRLRQQTGAGGSPCARAKKGMCSHGRGVDHAARQDVSAPDSAAAAHEECHLSHGCPFLRGLGCGKPQQDALFVPDLASLEDALPTRLDRVVEE
jgi:hypothetical protein